MLELIHRNPDSRIGLADAARIACCERSYFAKVFKRDIGMSFAKYVRKVKVARTLNLLETGRTVSDVAREVWDGEARTLQRTFRSEMGTTPTEVRRVLDTLKAATFGMF